MHEAKLHLHCHFITLTYSDVNLPPGASLKPEDMTLFLKRLRKKLGRCRYYYCGEYGGETQRPHYHMLLFGPQIPDLRRHGGTETEPEFRSPTIDSLWGLGNCVIGSVSFKSARYVAGYVVDKISGLAQQTHYETVVESTGEIIDRVPPFSRMSLKPGIGQGWFDQYASDVYPSDSVIVNGKEQKPPKFYDRKLEILSPTAHARIKRARTRRALRDAANNTPERLAVRKTVALSRLSLKAKKL